MSLRALRFAGCLVALAGCASSTAPTDAAADVATGDAPSDGATPTCPEPRPPELSPCNDPGFECVVPPDPAPPDAHVTPSGGLCRCDATSSPAVWRCFLAGGPFAPPELAR